jgi:dedicator of cytokinesis protein 3
VNVFSCTRHVTKTDRDGNEEVWLEKTCFTTEQAFPTVLRRSDITEWEVVEISPVDHAYTEVEQKTRELDALHLRYSVLAKTTQNLSTTALSMSLNVAVDPAADGIPVYRDVFFHPSYISRHPDMVEQVDRLRTAIDDQVRTVKPLPNESTNAPYRFA